MIIVIYEIIKGKQEFNNGNYEKALGHFENVGEDDEFYGYAQLFCANCLMELKRYDDALKIVNVLILQNPYNKLAWFNKVLCYIFSDDEQNALNIMDDVISVVDMGDKYDLVFLAKLYKLLHCYDDALRYCNMALEIDGEFREALYEKSEMDGRADCGGPVRRGRGLRAGLYGLIGYRQGDRHGERGLEAPLSRKRPQRVVAGQRGAQLQAGRQ